MPACMRSMPSGCAGGSARSQASGVTGEIYLTDLVRLAREDGRIVSAVGFEDDGRFDGINDRAQLAAAEWSLRVRLNEAHMRNGVTMRDPSTVYLDWDVDLASDVTLEPDVILRGATSIGEGSVIGPHSELVDATIGRNVKVWASVVERSTVEDDATIGPFSHLRPGSVVGRGAEVGNYAELKNTTLGAGVEEPPHELPRRRHDRREGQRRRGHHHGQLRRPPQAQDDDRGLGLPRRGHDARRAGHGRRRREDRRRRPSSTAISRRASSRSAFPPGSASPRAPTDDPAPGSAEGPTDTQA